MPKLYGGVYGLQIVARNETLIIRNKQEPKLILILPTPQGEQPNNTPNVCRQTRLSLSFLVLQV